MLICENLMLLLIVIMPERKTPEPKTLVLDRPTNGIPTFSIIAQSQ